MEMIIIYSTFADHAEAEKIARMLVQRKLVACANINAPHKAIYYWQGEVAETDQEVSAIFKTRAALFDQVEALISEHHSYDTPCIVAWPITQGASEFLQWIERNTGTVK